LPTLATRKAREHLREADPVMAGLIDAVGKLEDFRRRADLAGPGDHYAALVRSIVCQQLSTSAARAIWGRLVEYFGGHPPTPKQVLDADREEMRKAAGLSNAKVKYLRSLAEHVLDGSLALEGLEKLPDAEVIAQLTAVNGIGEWSSQMFLMFQLQRPDVLAAGDLGIRRAVERAYALPELPPPAEVQRIGAVWAPYRTLACLYLWSSLRVVPV
jgi:DNA-3-methyladenine glycosylase II